MTKMNAVGWFDIYVTEMDRAVRFYEGVLGVKLEPMTDPTGETEMMSFPSDMKVYGAAGALVKAAHARPGVGGTTLYFSVADCATQAGRGCRCRRCCDPSEILDWRFRFCLLGAGYRRQHYRLQFDEVIEYGRAPKVRPAI